MATLSGELLMFGSHDSFATPVGATVVVTRMGKAVASGVVDRDYRFAIELPAGIKGKLEVSVGAREVSSTEVQADGNDLDVTVVYNPAGPAY